MSFFSRLFGGDENGGDESTKVNENKAQAQGGKCPRCGEPIQAGAAFCGECGVSLLPPPPPPPDPKPANAKATGSKERNKTLSGERANDAARKTNNAQAAKKLTSTGKAAGPPSQRRPETSPITNLEAKGPPSARPALSNAQLNGLFAPPALQQGATIPRVEPAASNGGANVNAAIDKAVRANATTVRLDEPRVEQAKLEPAKVEPTRVQASPPAPTISVEPLQLVEPLSETPPASRGLAMSDPLLDDVDAGFDAIVMTEPLNGASAEPRLDTTADMNAARELFEQLAMNYARPLRDFMIELRWVDPPREWIDISMPCASELVRAADKIGSLALKSSLERFLHALEYVKETTTERTITGAAKTDLETAYAELTAAMPEGFAWNGERERREPVIVRSLLMQVPELRALEIDALAKAGLTSLDGFFLATPGDMMETAGLARELAEGVVETFQSYRKEAERIAPDNGRAAERKMVADLLRDLRAQNEGFERASSSWSEDASNNKKRLRRDRTNTLLKMSVVLARLGEVDLVSRIEKLSFDGKVREIERYLERAGANGKKS